MCFPTTDWSSTRLHKNIHDQYGSTDFSRGKVSDKFLYVTLTVRDNERAQYARQILMFGNIPDQLNAQK